MPQRSLALSTLEAVVVMGMWGIWGQPERSALSRRSEAPEAIRQDGGPGPRGMGQPSTGEGATFFPLRLKRKKEEEGRCAVILRWR